MKAVHLILAALIACIVSSCNQTKKEPTIQEQLALIDSLVSSKNNPITIDSYTICKIESNVELTANSIQYNGEQLSFFVIQQAIDRLDKASSLLLPSEVERFGQIADSITTIVGKEINYNKSVSFSTTGGLTIVANNNVDDGWHINLKPSMRNEFTKEINVETLKWLKDVLSACVNDAKQMKTMDEISQQTLPCYAIERPFFEKLDKEEGIQKTPSGLRYKVITKTEGKKPTTKDFVVCTYKGTNGNGEQIDAQDKVTMPVGALIPGFAESLKLMGVGSKYIFYIPSHLAYGPSRMSDQVKPFTTMVYEVELKEIQNPE